MFLPSRAPRTLASSTTPVGSFRPLPPSNHALWFSSNSSSARRRTLAMSSGPRVAPLAAASLLASSRFLKKVWVKSFIIPSEKPASRRIVSTSSGISSSQRRFPARALFNIPSSSSGLLEAVFHIRNASLRIAGSLIACRISSWPYLPSSWLNTFQ